MALATAGWRIYPPQGELQELAQRVVCWADHDPRVGIGTGGGTHLVIPLDLCQDVGEPLVLTPGGAEHACETGEEPTGWVVVANLTEAEVSGINPNGCTEVAAPTGLAVSNETDTTLDVSWDAVDDATSYLVRHREEGTSDPWVETTVSGTSTQLTGLTASTTYDITVQASVDGVLGTMASTTGDTTA